MKAAGGGSIINFGSISWMFGQDDLPVYAASKAGIHGFTKSLARYYGGDKIRCNTVVPGWVITDRQKELWLDDDGRKVQMDRQCLKEDLLAHDLARMVLFLASDDARMCTSQNFIVDAGWI